MGRAIIRLNTAHLFNLSRDMVLPKGTKVIDVGWSTIMDRANGYFMAILEHDDLPEHKRGTLMPECKPVFTDINGHVEFVEWNVTNNNEHTSPQSTS